MVEQYGGLHPDAEAQKFVKQVGQRIVQNSDALQTPYQYDFHLLQDPQVVNAFALPGGQVFITTAYLINWKPKINWPASLDMKSDMLSRDMVQSVSPSRN
jgi:predicted Zn-dependent protease